MKKILKKLEKLKKKNKKKAKFIFLQKRKNGQKKIEINPMR